MSVGRRIKEYRVAKRWSQAMLARALTEAKRAFANKGKEVNRESVSQWEKGTGYPRAENIVALAKVFDRPESDFERFGTNSSVRASDSAKRRIPLLTWPDLNHVTGGGAMSKHALARFTEYIEVDQSTPTEAFGVVIADNSMSPRFVAGEEVVIDPKATPVHNPADPDFVLVRLKNGEVLFREYRRRYPGDPSVYDLVAYHKDFQTQTVATDDGAELVGVMIEHRRKRRVP